MGLAQDQWLAPTAKTASYYIKKDDCGALFTNKGAAGAVTFYLPPIAEISAGWSVRFFVAAGQNLIVTAPSGKLIAFNNAAATSIAFQQASELIGNSLEIIYDGALYMAIVNMASEAVTITIS
jgi:hypothetical protein